MDLLTLFHCGADPVVRLVISIKNTHCFQNRIDRTIWFDIGDDLRTLLLPEPGCWIT
jgi:hypothetical protein